MSFAGIIETNSKKEIIIIIFWFEIKLELYYNTKNYAILIQNIYEIVYNFLYNQMKIDFFQIKYWTCLELVLVRFFNKKWHFF